MSALYVFGYGSLVNATTHALGPLIPARLIGWQRAWAHRIEARGITSLSIRPNAGTRVLGAIAAIPEGALAALDAREAGYDRVAIGPDAIEHQGPSAAKIVTYVSRSDTLADARYPILASYLDVVLQGFAQLYGPEAMSDVVRTTIGWSPTLADDRAAPIYPRATPISEPERAAIDAASPPFTRVPPPRP